jgi:dihydropteroate synthase
MGVLNITPDSFSDGGFYFDKEKAIAQGIQLMEEGADMLDIGGESTRPGAKSVSVQEEAGRVLPVIAALRAQTDIPISIDTTKAEVAREALAAGANILNDISALRFDPKLMQLAAEKNVPVILMHMQGMPKTMQIAPYYKNLLSEIKEFLAERMHIAESAGIKKENIIIDPGIGFGKTLEHNLSLIKHLNFLEELDRPILVGISRKAFIGKILDLPPHERLEGTIAAGLLSMQQGAHILRVHDVAALKRAVQVAEAIMLDRRHEDYLKCDEGSKSRYVQ